MFVMKVLAGIIAVAAHCGAGVPMGQLTEKGAVPLVRHRQWPSQDHAGPTGLLSVVEMLDRNSADRDMLGGIQEFWTARAADEVGPTSWPNVPLLLLDYGNTQYRTFSSVGSPPQDLTVQVVTGSSDLWYKESNFRVSDSKTAFLSARWCEITYGQGSVDGSLVRDDFILGPFSIHGQELMVAVDSATTKTLVAAGVLGLGRPSLSHTGDTVLTNLQRQYKISVFCLVLSGMETGSVLFFGDPDPSWMAGDLVWAPVVTPGYWAVQAQVDIVEGDDSQVSLRGPVILDSGTSYIGFPIPYAAVVLGSLVPPRALQRCSLSPAQLWFCPCDVAAELQHLDLAIEGTRFRIPREKLLSKQPDGNCILELMATPPGFPMIFGDTFLRTVVAVFDMGNERIGLSSRFLEDEEPMVPALSASWESPAFGREGADFVRVVSAGTFSVLFFLLGARQCALMFMAPAPAARIAEAGATPYHRVS